MRESVTAVALAGFAIATAVAQPARATFEVVSVKINRSGEIPMRITAPPGRFEATNVTARLLILNSYGLPDFRLANLPAWAGDERFDAAGRAAGPASRDEISAMVRSMLEDRFQLRAHRETRELPTYALAPASPDRRPGVALRTSSIDCSAPEDRSKCNTRITRLAATLTGIVGRVITDETGLPGAYDLELTFAPEGPLPPGALPAAADSDAPSLFTALREQLGLRLDGRRGPVEVLVVDSIERPTPD
jgi:uncharacterized protein (TIGR03435 family)